MAGTLDTIQRCHAGLAPACSAAPIRLGVAGRLVEVRSGETHAVDLSAPRAAGTPNRTDGVAVLLVGSAYVLNCAGGRGQRPGDALTVSVLRNTERLDVVVALTERPQQ